MMSSTEGLCGCKHHARHRMSLLRLCGFELDAHCRIGLLVVTVVYREASGDVRRIVAFRIAVYVVFRSGLSYCGNLSRACSVCGC